MSDQRIFSYFYVFVGRESESTSGDGSVIRRQGSQAEHRRSKAPLDYIVTTAFNRLEKRCDNEVKIIINPDRYNDLRHVFGISRLPGFGLANHDISGIELKTKPREVPKWWNIVKRKERQQILESGEYYSGVQRKIVEIFANDTDDFFNFIRDIHTANVDGGIPKVMELITKLLKERDIKNAGELFGKMKKFFPW